MASEKDVVPVIQADRDAAADHLRMVGYLADYVAKIRQGTASNPLVQAFAQYRHRLSSLPTHGEDVVERVARAIDEARCPGREGPYGGYDYGYDRAREIDPPVGGRYVVRDFRDPSSKEYGKWVHQTADRAEHEAAFKRLTDEHVARAALSVLPRIDQEVVGLLRRIEPHLDAIVCYASDMGEHEPNRLANDVRQFLSQGEGG